jgi:four helix bundle protein
MRGIDCRKYRGRMWQTGNGEFQHFLDIASGSASELEYHFLLARDLRFIGEEKYEQLNGGVVEIKRMLASLACKVGGRVFGGLTAEC